MIVTVRIDPDELRKLAGTRDRYAITALHLMSADGNDRQVIPIDNEFANLLAQVILCAMISNGQVTRPSMRPSQPATAWWDEASLT